MAVATGLGHEQTCLDGPMAQGELPVGEDAGEVGVVPLAVTGRGTRGRREHAGRFEFADLLDRAPGPAGDVDGTHPNPP
jgi:hypothetical protein